MGDLSTSTREDLFQLEKMPALPYEKDDNVQISVTIQRNLDKKQLYRFSYTFFDFLSDIGGLINILLIAISSFVFAFNTHRFDNIMVGKLFKEKDEGDGRDGEKEDKAWKPMQPSRIPKYQDLLAGFLPCCTPLWGRCRYGKRQTAFAKARVKLAGEINVY